MEEKSKGLGDTIAKITQATGLDKVAHIVAKIYNRALTAAEVKQNFQGIRKRFGL